MYREDQLSKTDSKRLLMAEEQSLSYDQPHAPLDTDPETEAMLRDIERGLPAHQKEALNSLERPVSKPSRRLPTIAKPEKDIYGNTPW